MSGSAGRSYVRPSLLLGFGFGGLFDGVVFHQILQWHHLLSSTRGWPTTTVHGLEVNTLADGLFHAAMLLLAGLGLLGVWRAGRQPHVRWSDRAFTGALLAGWGLFNILEGLLDHQLLGIHHVRPGSHQLAWDLAYLAWGALMAVVGGWLLKPSERGATDER